MTGTTNNEATTTSAASSHVVLQQPRETPSFQWSPLKDPEEWFEHVEFVRLVNRLADEETLPQGFSTREDSSPISLENY